jgi:hypothetical protein
MNGWKGYCLVAPPLRSLGSAEGEQPAVYHAPPDSGEQRAHGGMTPAVQAAIGIVAFFALGTVLVLTLRTVGIVLIAFVVGALLAVALVLQAITGSPWPAYAALGLAVLAAVARFALSAALWAEDRERTARRR